MTAERAADLRRRILELVAEYHSNAFPEREFIAGQTPVAVSGRVFDADELQHLVDASLDFWLTTGRFADRFEREFARWMGVRHTILVNSGSSANLLAVTALTADELGRRALRPGDEVITAAAGFPTTVNPIIQNRLVPVFVDSHIPTYNADPDAIDEAVSPRTRAIMLAHTLGNPFDLDRVRATADKHGLWLIEDTCDAVGSTWRGRKVGTFGDLATVSFYPAHHMTMGEGGAVLTRSPTLKKIVESFRDWGRDCWCEPGKDNTCGKRFELAARSAPARLRPQVHVQPHWLQPEADGHAGGRWRRPVEKARRVRRAAPRELCLPSHGFRAALRPAEPPGSDTWQRSKLVRIPDHHTGRDRHLARCCHWLA